MGNTKNTILIVDDSAKNRSELMGIFSSDYQIIEADSGAAAITYLNNAIALPALILADYQMPAINGLELLQALKESSIFRGIPVILLFDSSEENLIDPALASGADEIFVRPLHISLLKKRVNNMIELHPPVYYKNIMELLVVDEVEQCIGDLGICTCMTCRNDLIALTLNHLPPKYVNTDKGAALSKADKLSASAQAQIITCIASAAEVVKKYPRHKK